MACLTCQKKAAAIAAGRNVLARAESVSLGTNNNELQTLYDSGEFEFVRYMGAAYTHLISPRAAAIVRFNLASYGQGRKGDVILVHNEDIKAAPDIFVKLPKNSPVLKKYLIKIERYDVATKKIEPEVKKKVKKEETVVIEENKTVDNEVVPEEEKSKDLSTATVEIKKSEALTTVQYAEKYGYTHHLQVLGLVKSNQLKSFKNEVDDKTYVYTVED